MLNKKLCVLILSVAVLALLVGCGSKKTATPTTAPPTQAEPTADIGQPTADSQPMTAVAQAPTQAPTDAPTASPEPTEVPPTPEPTEPPPTPTPVIVDEDLACLDCHTDKDRLKELAVEDEVEELSSGEG